MSSRGARRAIRAEKYSPEARRGGIDEAPMTAWWTRLPDAGASGRTDLPPGTAPTEADVARALRDLGAVWRGSRGASGPGAAPANIAARFRFRIVSPERRRLNDLLTDMRRRGLVRAEWDPEADGWWPRVWAVDAADGR